MLRKWNLLDRILEISEISSAEFKKIEDEECGKILSLSGSKLFKYAEYVTSSGSINRSFGWYYFMFCEIRFKNHDNSDAEAMIKSIGMNGAMCYYVPQRIHSHIMSRRLPVFNYSGAS